MLPERYNWNNFRESIRNPKRFVRKGTRLCLACLDRLSTHAFRKRYGDGIDVMDRDWDNLIILDATRYDVFEEENSLKGDLQRVVSRGSQSREFIEENFVDRTLHDTVYVTGNGKAERLEEGVFHAVLKTYADSDRVHEGFYPERVADDAREAHERYPNKRLIVHFMQPHPPFLGDRATELKQSLESNRDVEFTKMRTEAEYEARDIQISNLRTAARKGIITRDQLVTVYRENLRVGLEFAEALIEDLDGKSVVTSDHGEMLGRPDWKYRPRKKFGHPYGVVTPELRFVPWLELPADERRDVTSEDPVGIQTADENAVRANLEALGYV